MGGSTHSHPDQHLGNAPPRFPIRHERHTPPLLTRQRSNPHEFCAGFTIPPHQYAYTHSILTELYPHHRLHSEFSVLPPVPYRVPDRRLIRPSNTCFFKMDQDRVVDLYKALLRIDIDSLVGSIRNPPPPTTPPRVILQSRHRQFERVSNTFSFPSSC